MMLPGMCEGLLAGILQGRPDNPSVTGYISGVLTSLTGLATALLAGVQEYQAKNIDATKKIEALREELGGVKRDYSSCYTRLNSSQQEVQKLRLELTAAMTKLRKLEKRQKTSAEKTGE